MSSLKGKTVVVTRARSQSSEFMSLLEKTGAKSIPFPTIEIVSPDSWEECDTAIKNLASYDALILSSTNAVDKFFSRLENDSLELLKRKSVYVVGEKTKAVVEKYGISPVDPPAVFDGKHLAEKILSDDVSGKRFLAPKGNLGKSTIRCRLEEKGAVVDEAIVYKTVAPSIAEAENITRKFSQKEIDVITFFSPSAVENCAAIVPAELLNSAVIAVIGNATKQAAEEHQLNVSIVADPSTTGGMMESLEKYFAE